MARFDYHRSPDGQGWLLEVQSDHLYQLPTRIVVPLMPPAALPPIRDLNPLLIVEGETLALMPQYIASVPASLLRRPLGNLLDQADDITRALDILLTGF